jgi:adenine deaminase
VSGFYVSPGLIDSHLHLEGLHLLPDAGAHAFLAHGTTTIITDLHEIANAGGLAAMFWYLDLLENVPVDVFVMAPSCVPSCAFERGFGTIGLRELKKLRSHQRVVGLGEVMDVPGVVRRDRSILQKIELFAGQPVDGHAPMVSGGMLRTYCAAGIGSDHETTNPQEGLEKLANGMHLFLRHGSVSKDLERLLPLIKPRFLSRLSLCTDDLSAQDLFEKGHLDSVIRLLVRRGVSLVNGVRLATANAARYFKLTDRGRLAPGKKADIVIFEDPEGLDKIRVRMTIKDGRIVYERGKRRQVSRVSRSAPPSQMKIAPYSIEELRRKAPAHADGHTINVIGVGEGTILTDHRILEARIENGYLQADTQRDIIYAYVFDRYRGQKAYGFGFVQGFSLRGGAIGTTYAHDSHNLVIVGDNIADILLVLNALRQDNGGMALVRSGELAEQIPMPFYGIMSDLGAGEFLRREKRLRNMLRGMGVRLTNPFFQMSFLSLPVIPALRLTTHGLFDATQMRYIEVSSQDRLH